MIKLFLSDLIKNGWTQEKIAEKAGIKQTQISRFLKGKSCTIETLVKIAEAFNVSTDTVLGRNKQKELNGTIKRTTGKDKHHRSNHAE